MSTSQILPRRSRTYKSNLADSERWTAYRSRKDDVLISTPPKSGTTWMQTMCALLLLGWDDFDAQPGVISPWYDMNPVPVEEVNAMLEAQSHRRFIKTLESILTHDASFVHFEQLPNIHLFHYQLMREDTEGTIARLASVLGVPMDAAAVARVGELSSFEHMQSNAGQFVPSADLGLWKDESRFFAKARSSAWKSVLSPNALAQYRERIEQIGEQQQISSAQLNWLHQSAENDL